MTKKHDKKHKQLLQGYFGGVLSKQEESELRHNIEICDKCRAEFERGKDIEKILKESKPFLKPFYDLDYKQKIERFQRKQQLIYDISKQFIEEDVSEEKDIFEIVCESVLEFVSSFKEKDPKNWKLKPFQRFATSLSFAGEHPEIQLSSPYIILSVSAVLQYLYEHPSKIELPKAKSLIAKYSRKFISSTELRKKFEGFLLLKVKELL